MTLFSARDKRVAVEFAIRYAEFLRHEIANLPDCLIRRGLVDQLCGLRQTFPEVGPEQEAA